MASEVEQEYDLLFIIFRDICLRKNNDYSGKGI
jgi:hypothetical protein